MRKLWNPCDSLVTIYVFSALTVLTVLQYWVKHGMVLLSGEGISVTKDRISCLSSGKMTPVKPASGKTSMSTSCNKFSHVNLCKTQIIVVSDIRVVITKLVNTSKSVCSIVFQHTICLFNTF